MAGKWEEYRKETRKSQQRALKKEAEGLPDAPGRTQGPLPMPPCLLLSTSGENQDSFLEKLQCIEKCVNENTVAIHTLSSTGGDTKEQMKGLTSNWTALEQKVLSLTKENDVLHDPLNEIETFKRRWNLKISGVPQHKDENVKMTVIDLLSRVSPGIKDFLQNSVDVAFCLR